MRKNVFLVATAVICLSACTNTDNPQLAMCQAVAQQLTSKSISSWDSDSKNDSDRSVTVKVAYTNSGGQAGTLNCMYPKHENGDIDTAPSDVVWNNQKVDRKVLLTAGTAASKELLAGTYKNTVERSTELAGQAADKANKLANQAKDAAIEGAKTLQELQK